MILEVSLETCKICIRSEQFKHHEFYYQPQSYPEPYILADLHSCCLQGMIMSLILLMSGSRLYGNTGKVA